MMHVCHWWCGSLLANPLRKLVQDPAKVLSPYVKPGMIVLEPGPGMGYFTIALARLVGPAGKVVAVDLQQQMLVGLSRRAAKAGLAARIEARQAGETTLAIGELAGKVDFALLFWLVHEVPDQDRFLGEVVNVLRPGAKVLFAEPKGHVTHTAFEATLGLCEKAGFKVESRPEIWWSRSALLVRA